VGPFQKVPSGYFGGHFSKELTTYLLGNNQANCFRAHKELTIDPLGKFPLAPSDYNFSSIKHTNNNMLAPMVPSFEGPSQSPSVFVHGPQQVW
jgi:hypothetical protein